MEFSLIIPCYNEAGNIDAFCARVDACFRAASPGPYELIFVDDGSTDATLAKLLEHQAADPDRITMVELSRNFGKEAAMLAGLHRARGRFIGIIDADMQQDPATSLDMLRFLQSHPEYDSVAAVQKERREGPLLRLFKRRFYRTFNAVGEVELPANASDFRVFRRTVADALMSMPEYYRFSKGLFAWVGFRTYCMEYQPAERAAGTSSWSLRKLLGYAWSGIASFSIWPLRLILYLGLLTSLAATVYLIVVICEFLFVGVEVPGYPTLVCLILLFCGIVMLALGVFGEYIGRIYMEGKRRPPYIVRSAAGPAGAAAGATGAGSAWMAGSGGAPAAAAGEGDR